MLFNLIRLDRTRFDHIGDYTFSSLSIIRLMSKEAYWRKTECRSGFIFDQLFWRFGRQGFPGHTPDPASPPPFTWPPDLATFFPVSPFGLRFARLHVGLVVNVDDPSLSLSLNFYASNYSLFDPLATLQVQCPFLVAPLPSARRLDVFEESSPFGPVPRNSFCAHRVVWRGRKDPALPFFIAFAVRRAVLELEDLDVTGLRSGVEQDVR